MFKIVNLIVLFNLFFQSEELHEQLKLTNQSLEELSQDRTEAIEHFSERQRKLVTKRKFFFTFVYI